jgi:hypothetical protein
MTKQRQPIMNSQAPSETESECALYQARITPPVAWSGGPFLVMRKIPITQRATASGPKKAQRRLSAVVTVRCSFRASGLV